MSMVGALLTVTLTGIEVVVTPEPSVTMAVNEYCPLGTSFQLTLTWPPPLTVPNSVELAKRSTLLITPDGMLAFAVTTMFECGEITEPVAGLLMLILAGPFTRMLIESETFLLPPLSVATAANECRPSPTLCHARLY